ncbi:MAG: rod shape-determining protein [Porphyrobacter sp.]|jgi:rod shape-determining protein MreB|nr:rod shape-determining protein [Porphyrobacter sp.]
MRQFFTSSAKPDLAIDFGTANTRVVTAGSGIAFDEPSLCCFTKGSQSGELVASGAAAQAMKDHTTGNLHIVKPLNRGVLADIAAARHFLAYAVRASVGQRRLRSFQALIGVPADATNAERGALLTAARDAGLGAVKLMSEPLAAARGANLPVDEPQGSMIVECGAGTTEAAVLSLGGICAAASRRGGGDALDAAIIDHLHFQHKFLIGPSTAEGIKFRIVDWRPDTPDAATDIAIKGRSLVTGLPQVISLPVQDLLSVAARHTAGITKMVIDLLARLSPELSRDVHDNGIVLTGGSAAIALIRSALMKETGLHVSVAPNAPHCVALGLQKALAH